MCATASGEHPKYFIVSNEFNNGPSFAVIDGGNIERSFRAYGVRGRLFETNIGGPPLPGFGSVFFMTTRDLDVQLEPGGDYHSLDSLVQLRRAPWTLLAGGEAVTKTPQLEAQHS